MENLRENYNCGGYVATREHGENGGRTHYHVICSLPYIDFRTLNGVWCNTISDICVMSANALQTTRRKSVIYDHAGALRYVCKYISKGRGQSSDSRIVFISRNLTVTPAQYRIHESVLLDGYCFVHAKIFDYCTVYTIRDREEFKKFCREVLYPSFEDITAGNDGMVFFNPDP
jgi:hypothetical protein